MSLLNVLGLGLALVIAGQASAQGVGSPIVVAQTAAFTGGPSPSVVEMTAGAQLIIDAENAKGGVHGRQIKLVSMDDGFDAKRAAVNTEKLITQHKPVAMFLSRGTPTAEAMLPVLNKYKVPLIAPSTGAMVLRNPVQPLVFNVRSSYQGEARKSVEQIVGMGFSRIGIIYVDDSFGGDAIIGVMEGFKRSNATPLFVEKYDRNEKDFTRVVESATAAKPPALLLIGATGPTIAILKGLQATGMKSYVATLSTNASGGFLDSVGEAGKYVIVSQVFPNERATAIPLVREITDLAKAATGKPAAAGEAADGPSLVVRQFLAGGAKVSPAMLEGAAGAKVLIAGLKRAGQGVTPMKLVSALESGGRIDVGWPGFDVAYTDTNHSGIEFVDLSIVSNDDAQKRRFRR
ncbi:ABC transporter substrate-binding protein (plasmid) [Sphaerotilaceae bacterium SBD11-9]